MLFRSHTLSTTTTVCFTYSAVDQLELTLEQLAACCPNLLVAWEQRKFGVLECEEGPDEPRQRVGIAETLTGAEMRTVSYICREIQENEMGKRVFRQSPRR